MNTETQAAVQVIAMVFWPVSAVAFGCWMDSAAAGWFWLSATWLVSVILDTAAEKVGR